VRIAIVGSGSAAKQHLTASEELGLECVLITQRDMPDSVKTFKSIFSSESEYRPTHYIVANASHLHSSTIAEIRSMNSEVLILCEKPLMNCEWLKSDRNVRVGFNLRFCAELMALKSELRKLTSRVNSVSIEYGRDLRTWRASALREDSYSKFSSKGGGVLHDLSHELDFIVYLFGKPSKLVSIGGSFSDITTDSYDLFNVFLKCDSYDVGSIHLNCVSPEPFRKIRILGKDIFLEADLIQHTLRIGSETQFFESTPIFKNQLRVFLEKPNSLPGVDEGIYIDNLIKSIVSSNTLEQWVSA
jgi:predicted dehydrogenase